MADSKLPSLEGQVQYLGIKGAMIYKAVTCTCLSDHCWFGVEGGFCALGLAVWVTGGQVTCGLDQVFPEVLEKPLLTAPLLPSVHLYNHGGTLLAVGEGN